MSLYSNAEKDIANFQTILAQYTDKQIDKNTCIDKLLEIYKYNGHAIGFYMSNQIVKAGLKNEMLRSFYNPYEFYLLYNRAVHKNKSLPLSSDFMRFLKNATSRYYPMN